MTVIASSPNILSNARRTASVLLAAAGDHELESLGAYLRKSGLVVLQAFDAAAVEGRLSTAVVDVILLDSDLPGDDGLSFCRRASMGGFPLLILLVPAEDTVERIIGLEAGADDCLGKPVNPREVLARIRALIRRARSSETQVSVEDDEYVFSGWRLSPRTQRAYAPDGVVVPLAPNEYALLRCFLERPRKLLLREELHYSVGGQEDLSLRIIDSRVSRLRGKLSAFPGGADLIQTERGRGYTFQSSVERVVPGAAASSELSRTDVSARDLTDQIGGRVRPGL